MAATFFLTSFFFFLVWGEGMKLNCSAPRELDSAPGSARTSHTEEILTFLLLLRVIKCGCVCVSSVRESER